MRLFILSLLLGFAFPAAAFYPQFNPTTIPYEVHTVEYSDAGATYLNELKGFPDMYEINLTSTTTVPLRLLQVAASELPPLSLLVVRVAERGVAEVARVSNEVDGDFVHFDTSTALTFFEHAALSVELSPGTYRIEVSSPENYARYALVFGEGGERRSFYNRISGLLLVYEFFDRSKLRVLVATPVSVPLGALVVGSVGALLWYRRRHPLSHA